ncbi:TRAF-type zinc finger domain-containing protein 1 isoform X2 [Rhineura floridana]|nr:TRAF-type zinc finger domain-containing protein 1 isoform X2 [Rhineura floridana]
MRNHEELEHTQVICKCSMKMDSGLLQEHVASECPLRPVACQHCDIELAFSKLQDHEDYCGARTERCSRCSRNVLLRDLKEHPEDCEKEAEEARVSQAKPCSNSEAVLCGIQTVRNVLHPDDSVRPLPRLNRFPESRLYNCLLGDQLPSVLNERNVALSQPDRNRVQLEKMTSRSFGGEPDCNLDYLLALSLQHEGSSHEHGTTEIQSDLWKNICPARAKPPENFIEANETRIFCRGLLAPDNTSNRPKTETLLPCEFCEELFPEEDLILHQTSCNPATALASFSKRSSFVSQTKCLQELWDQLHGSQSTGSREALPLQHDAPSSFMLPCEFCGVQLEEEILFHHQDQCDMRPATAPSTGRTPSPQRAPAVDNSGRTESPGLPRRRIRHQGEISPQYLEEFRQQKPPHPIRGSHSRSNLAATRCIQQTPPNNSRENSVGSSELEKSKDLRGDGRRPPGVPAAAPLPTRRSPLNNFLPSNYVPSFSVMAPTRPGQRREGGTSPAGSAHYNSAKAKPWRAESDYPDEEQ